MNKKKYEKPSRQVYDNTWFFGERSGRAERLTNPSVAPGPGGDPW